MKNKRQFYFSECIKTAFIGCEQKHVLLRYVTDRQTEEYIIINMQDNDKQNKLYIIPYNMVILNSTQRNAAANDSQISSKEQK